MSLSIPGKILTDSEQRITALCKELEKINEKIEKSSLDSRVEKVKTRTGREILLTVRDDDSPLKELGSRIAEIDSEFQENYVCKNALLKTKFQTLFDQVFNNYKDKSDELWKPEEAGLGEGFPVEERTPRPIHARQADQAIEKALKKIAAPQLHDTDRSKPSVEKLRPFVHASSPLHVLYQVRNQTPEKIAQAFLQLPQSLRRELAQTFGLMIEDEGALKGASEHLQEGDIQNVAFGLGHLSVQERALLLARLEKSGRGEHQKLAVYIKAFEDFQWQLALNVAGKGAKPLEVAIDAIVKKTIDASEIDLDALIGAEPAPAYRYPARDVLTEQLRQAEAHRICVFARFYGEVTAILHKTAPDQQKKAEILQLIKKLDPANQQDLYGKIYELNPQRQPRDGWGERHVLDNWGILLDATFAFCSKKDHPLKQLFLDLQKKLHNPKYKNSSEVQKSIKKLLEQAKMKLTKQDWQKFKDQFFNRFPGAEKWKWGLGGEEREAHKYPYHILATLHQILSPFSRPEYWEAMQKSLQELPDSSDSNQNEALKKLRNMAKLLPENLGQPFLKTAVVKHVVASKALSPEEARWQCYNAIKVKEGAEAFGELQQSPFFDKVWRMAPLCRELYSGQEENLDDATKEEMGKRLKLLETLEKARMAIHNRYPIDRDGWDALVLRLIFQETPICDTESEKSSWRTLLGGLEDLAADTTYDPATAKELLHLLVDMSSQHLVAQEISRGMSSADKAEFISGNRRKELGPVMSAKAGRWEELDKGLSLKEARLLALFWPLQGKSPDYTSGPRQFKELLFFKDQQGQIRAKLKPLDRAMKNNGKYTIDHFYRELASSAINDTLGFNSTIPTMPLRLTLGEAILMLADRYLVAPPIGDKIQDAEKMLNMTHPLLQKVIRKQLPQWDLASPLQKSRALRLFYEMKGATELLKGIVKELEKGAALDAVLPMFNWLPTNIRYSIYGALYQIKPMDDAPIDYGESAFHNQKGFSSTPQEKMQAIKAVKEFASNTGLQPSYEEEGLGALQPWMPNVRDVASDFTKDKTAAARLIGLPKEHIDQYAISHLLKGHGDSHMGNTLISRAGTFFDCDEEHAIPPSSDFNDQIMWEMGLPQSKTPVRPLLLRLLVHPYFGQASQNIAKRLLQPVAQKGRLMKPYSANVRQKFQLPLTEMGQRATKLQAFADKALKAKEAQHQLSTRQMFFKLYGGEKEYKEMLSNQVPKERHALVFEQYLGKSAHRVVPLRKNLKEPYRKNVTILSKGKV